MEVSVIIVSMNNYEVLSRCLDSIRTHTSTSYEVFVVAYLFSPENLQHLRQNYPWILGQQQSGIAKSNRKILFCSE